MIDAPIYIDWILAIVMGIAACVQYVWLSFHGHSLGRWMQALGFTGLAIRIGWALSAGEDPPIAAVSVPLLMIIAAGASITAMHQMRMLWMDVRCMQDHRHRCFREDRVKAAILERGRK